MAMHQEAHFNGRGACTAKTSAAKGDPGAEAQWPLLLLGAIVFTAFAILSFKRAISNLAACLSEPPPRTRVTGADPLEEKLRRLDSVLNHKGEVSASTFTDC
jgi:hypothetical protein